MGSSHSLHYPRHNRYPSPSRIDSSYPMHPYFHYPAQRQMDSSYPPYPTPRQMGSSSYPIHRDRASRQMYSSYPPYPVRRQMGPSPYPSMPPYSAPSQTHPLNLPPEEREDKSRLPQVDTSEALFTMYLDRSDEDDKNTTERWKRESDAILIFTGLFSAALAALLSISVQGLQPGSQDTSAFYLGNIYRLLAGTTSPQPTAPSNPPKFSAPKYAVLVNSLWFLSLVMSLTGALLAVFIQQWAQSYLEATQGRYNPKDRARIRAFHAEGLKKLDLHRVTRAVPILIHVSLFLFFAGLPIFLFNVNRTVFNVVVTWLAICVAGYACITLMPIFYENSPYYSPLSSSIWWCVTNTLFIIYRLLKNFMSCGSRDSRYDTHHAKFHFHWPSLRAMHDAAGQFARDLPPDIDYRALSWMFSTLNDDEELEQFFDALPSFCESKELEDPQRDFIKPNEKILSHALIGMMDRTLLSDLVAKEVKQRRIIICTKAIDATSLLGPLWTLRRVLFRDWHGFSKSIHFGLFVQRWKNISRPVTTFYAQFVVAVTLANVQERDDHWFELASGQLNLAKSLLRNYYTGDTILLANAIFIIRRTIQINGSEDDHRKDIFEASSRTLELICRFDIQNTLPELQHQFCSLWNQLVAAVQDDVFPHATLLCMTMLKTTRRLYITLHKDTPCSPTEFSPSTDDGDSVLDKARSYPQCTIDQHSHSLSVPNLQLEGPPRDAPPVTDTSMGMMPPLAAMGGPIPPPMATSHGGPYSFMPTPLSSDASHPFVPNLHYPIPPGIRHPGGIVPPHLGPPYFVPPEPSFSNSVPASPFDTTSYHQPYYSQPLVPDQFPYTPVPAPPGGIPSFVPIPQMASSRTRRSRRRRRRRGVPATTAEADPRRDAHDFRTRFSFIPGVAPRRRVNTSSESTSTSSSPEIPAQNEPPVFRPVADIPGLTSAPTNSMPFIPQEAVVPEMQFVPPMPSLGPLSLPPVPSITTGGWPYAGSKQKGKKKKRNAPTQFYSPAVPSSPSRNAGILPIPGPSRRSIATPPQLYQPIPVTSPYISPYISQPIQLPPDTDSPSHSNTDVSFATAPSASSVPVPPSLLTRMTGGNSRGSPPQSPLAVPSVIEVNGYGEFSGLLHDSLHSLVYEDKIYPTALHLFEARKYIPHQRNIAERVRQCESVEQLTSISAELADFVRQDWGSIMLSIMDEVLHLKFCQHNGLRALLFSTYPAELVYDDLRDRFWGRDGTGAGRNELGKSLMRVRERLRNGGGSAGVAPVLRVSWYGEYSVLLCHSSHDVEYEKGLYPTALHLFEARKFLDHRPDLADRIRRCENVEEVNVVSAELAEFTRRDWDNVALSTMDEVLYLKFRQHNDLRTLLLSTHPADLVYVETGDSFWGDGGDVGTNELGKSLVRVRERIRTEGQS